MNPVIVNLDVRQHILDTAQNIIGRKGYSSVGLSEILNASNVPKGSFYYYFKSKDAFGEALLQNYFVNYFIHMDTILRVENETMMQRIINYWESWLQSQATCDCQGKCLAVKLAAEVADLSEPMRLALKEGTTGIVERLTSAIETAILDGSLTTQIDPKNTAQTLYHLWLGASLIAKVNRDMAPMNLAMAVTKDMFKFK